MKSNFERITMSEKSERDRKIFQSYLTNIKKLKGVKPTGRLEAAGSWNAMVTHRVRIGDPRQIDKAVLAWLRQAYDAAA
jgi:hypothetical protein